MKRPLRAFLLALAAFFVFSPAWGTAAETYPIVDTGQTDCYDAGGVIAPPSAGQAFYGQDAQFSGNQPSYSLSADGLTVYDNVTGLTWTRSPDLNGDGLIDIDDKLNFADANAYPAVLNAAGFAGYNDWRLPSIKELYSLMNFTGTDPSGIYQSNLVPFVDTDYFDFAYGDESAGERLIDAQFWSSTAYIGKVFTNRDAAFGLNLGDGRIKGYPQDKVEYLYFVRGNTAYGINDFVDNGDGTVTDRATGLMWSQDDSGDGISSGPSSGMMWEDALAWVQAKNAENYLGYSDWRLPNAKELQSIVDYSRAPDVTSSAAIDPIFNITQISNEAGQADYPWFWASTSFVKNGGEADNAVYVTFGRAMGYMNGSWMDVHGAGAQRSDRKDGDFSMYTYVPSGYYFAMAPQGDSARLYNYVRLVRDAGDEPVVTPCPGGEEPVDTDGDGTPDCIDNCPYDSAKLSPGACGCGIADTDTDGDGTPDCIDECPDDARKIEPGTCGCGLTDTDSDGDGTPDCNDACPWDPAKLTPGSCGCGDVDLDSDGDGVLDCQDDCPYDPAKLSPGSCGCGVADVDSDGDGTPDCIDNCPDDPAKTEPGTCGCGVADTDCSVEEPEDPPTPTLPPPPRRPRPRPLVLRR